MESTLWISLGIHFKNEEDWINVDGFDENMSPWMKTCQDLPMQLYVECRWFIQSYSVLFHRVTFSYFFCLQNEMFG